jgi:spore germination protein
LLLSFPLYGYEWQVKGRKLRSATIGQGIHTSFAPIPAGLLPDFQFNVQDQVRQYGATHDPVSGSSYYQFKRKNGQFVEGWFEDWWTLGRKSDYLADEQLGGIAFFMLGYDNGQLVDYFLRRRGPKSRQDITNRIQKIDAVVR